MPLLHILNGILYSVLLDFLFQCAQQAMTVRTGQCALMDTVPGVSSVDIQMVTKYIPVTTLEMKHSNDPRLDIFRLLKHRWPNWL